jgi:GDPmannose 4,6-dehydratase
VKKVALIIGCNGQDGQLLTTFLLNKNYLVKGIERKNCDILNQNDVFELVQETKADEVYYLAAYHHSSEKLPESDEVIYQESFRIHHDGLVHFLEAICQFSPSTRLFYASSSHIFGHSEDLQTEKTPFSPVSAYAKTKIAGMEVCKTYRNTRNIFASVGILYNHESPLRSPQFVSRKITQSVAQIALGSPQKLEVGEIDAVVDWGYAGDFVEAMWLTLQATKSDEFVVSTGQARTIREFLEVAFGGQGLEYSDHLVIRNDIIKRVPLRRVGDYSKLLRETGWRPKVSFQDMITMMVQCDIDLLKAR